MAVWDLSVTVEDLGPDALPITVSVTSDLHVGGVILKLVEKTRRLLLTPEEKSLIKPEVYAVSYIRYSLYKHIFQYCYQGPI